MPLEDQFNANTLEITAPYRGLVAVTPSDTVDLSNGFTRGIFISYVAGGSNLTVDTPDNTDITLTGLLGGSFIPLRVKRVYATGTNATGIVAAY